MGFGEAINTCVKQKYATFQGRAARSEYWWFGLFFTLAMAVTGAVGGIAIGMTRSDGSQPGAGVILAFVPLIVVTLGLIIPSLAVTIRRLHDRDMSGWWYLGIIVLGAIPVIGFVFTIGFLVLMCLKGTAGPNRFGRDPLGPLTSADVFA